MNRCVITTVLACLAFSHFGQASEQERINKTFRELRRLPDGTTEVGEALPLVKTLMRLDPEHGRKYFNEYLEKIVPEGPLSASQALQEVAQITFSENALFHAIAEATKGVERKLQELQSKGDKVTLEDMFKMQMLMNHLSQLSEMSTNVVSASNSAISSMARNVKS